MPPYSETIQVLFTEQADPVAAVPMKRYMRNQFEYLGLKSPQIRALRKEHFDKHGLPPLTDLDTILRELWALPEREFNMLLPVCWAGSRISYLRNLSKH